MINSCSWPDSRSQKAINNPSSGLRGLRLCSTPSVLQSPCVYFLKFFLTLHEGLFRPQFTVCHPVRQLYSDLKDHGHSALQQHWLWANGLFVSFMLTAFSFFPLSFPFFLTPGSYDGVPGSRHGPALHFGALLGLPWRSFNAQPARGNLLWSSPNRALGFPHFYCTLWFGPVVFLWALLPVFCARYFIWSGSAPNQITVVRQELENPGRFALKA